MDKKVRIANRSPVSGIALIFALLLLLVLTVIGIGTLSSVRMQERMAGNANLQALAFKAASVGVTEAVEWGLDPDNWLVNGSLRTCVKGVSDWQTNWDGPWTLNNIDGLPAGFTARFERRIGCFEAPNWIQLVGSDTAPPVQLLALSRGQVLRPDGEVVAEREIEIRLERRGGEVVCIMELGCLDEINMPTSIQFNIEGDESGCPIRACSDDDASDIRTELREGRNNSLVGNYTPVDPGIHHSPSPLPWADAVVLARAVNALKIGIRADDAWVEAASNWAPIDPDDEDETNPFEDNPFAYCRGTLKTVNAQIGGGGQCGGSNWSPVSEQELQDGITYIAGNFVLGGNVTAGPGATIIVEGAVCMRGTASFKGDIVALGGLFELKGGGGNQDLAVTTGQLHLNNLRDAAGNRENQGVGERMLTAFITDRSSPNVVTSQLSNLDMRGGGRHTFNSDCEEWRLRWARANRCLADLEALVLEDRPEALNFTPPTTPSPGFGFTYQRDLLGLSPELETPDFGHDDGGGEQALVRFPVLCGDELGGRRNVIASWREFIDSGRWGN